MKGGGETNKFTEGEKGEIGTVTSLPDKRGLCSSSEEPACTAGGKEGKKSAVDVEGMERGENSLPAPIRGKGGLYVRTSTMRVEGRTSSGEEGATLR